MSRSYKKFPYAGRKDKGLKKYANRKFRKDKFNDLQHNAYKKHYETYNICDYKSVEYSFDRWWQSELEFWYRFGYRRYPFPNKEEEYQKWYRYYKMK